MHKLLIYVRAVQRMLTWDDCILSFGLSIVLGVLVLLSYAGLPRLASDCLLGLTLPLMASSNCL
jgi:hypothetical protein